MNVSQKEERIRSFLQGRHRGDIAETESQWTKDPQKRPQFRPQQQPSSIRHTSNTPQEEKRLLRAIEFQQTIIQDRHKHHRNSLFLIAKNEYGVDKLVCTTIRPTLLPYPELGGCDTLESCAVFVAHFLQYECLVNAHQLPSYLPSSMHILKWDGMADCFDYATFLTSLLIGSGYDAYVVQGYAPRYICERDLSVMECPDIYLHPQEDCHVPNEQESMSTSRSCFSKPVDHLIISEEEQAVKRIHCWVLVLPTNANNGTSLENTDGPIFVEPTTGDIFPLSEPHHVPYTAIGSLWNTKNYWLNLQVESATPTLSDENSQERSASIQGVSFDLSNQETWLPLFSSTNNARPEAPTSWAEKIWIPESSVQLRYLPDGQRSLLYHKSKVELFPKGGHPNGIMSRVSTFHDVDRTDLIQCREVYAKRRREDHLFVRLREPQKMQETFYPGHSSGICLYTELVGRSWTVQFNSEVRLDGLKKREERYGECFVEEYSNRGDGIVKRIITTRIIDEDELKSKQETHLLPAWRRGKTIMLVKVV